MPTDVRGKDRVDDRRVISDILHVIKSGCRWCDCPPEYGPPTTISNRFVRWAMRGVIGNIDAGIHGAGDPDDRRFDDVGKQQAIVDSDGSRPGIPI